MTESGTAHGHEGQTQQHALHQEKTSMFAWLKTPLGIFFLIMVIAVVILTVFFRIPMLKFYGFYEPDGFYHYSVIRDAVQHGFMIQKYLPISGYPGRNEVTEPYGLYWVTLVPYFFLRFFGVSYYTVERLIPLLFGVLDVLGAYLLSRYISKDKFFGLLVMVFVALSGGDEARTSALIYRGDGFVAIFLLLALVFLLEVFRNKERNKKIIYAALSGIMLALCSLVFSGAAFAIGIYALSFFLMLIFAFIFSKGEMIDDLKYPLLGIFVWWILSDIFLGLGWIQSQIFVGLQFLYIFIPMLLGWLLLYLIANRSEIFSKYLDVRNLLGTPLRRVALLIALGIILTLVFWFGANGFLYTLFVNNGFITSTNSHAAATSGAVSESTIQELQPPTPQFLFASFVIGIYTTPPSLMVLFSSYISNYFNVIFILMLVTFLPYFFMQVYDSGGFMSGRPRLMFDINKGMLVLMAYFAITAYLQMHAIRFNSLISVPLAILSAYTVYWLINYSKYNADNNSKFAIATAFVFALIIMFSLWTELGPILPGVAGVSQAAGLVSLVFAITIGVLLLLRYFCRDSSMRNYLNIVIIILMVIYAYFQYPAFSPYTTVEAAAILMLLAFIVIAIVEWRYDYSTWYAIGIVLFVYVLVYYNALYTAGLVQADSLDPAFFSALQWFGANTPQNASVLTLWPDGSVVEGIANRSSVMDSVGAQNFNVADPFAAWLLNTSDDTQFLANSSIGKPGYFIIRYTWMSETGGIYTEAAVANPGLAENDYSYVQFQSFSESPNTSSITLQFTSPPQSGAQLVAEVYIPRNSSSALQSSIVVVNATTGRELGTLPLSTVTFYNDSSGTFSQIRVSNVSALQGYTLLLNYSSVPRSGASVNITGAFAVASGLANSNMFKFLYLCSSQACVLDNNMATYQLVYQDSDTKIFKINYNSSI